MKKWILSLLVLLVWACDNDEPEMYDAEAQLLIDEAIIDDYLSQEGITALQDDATGIRYVILTEGPDDVYPEVGDSLSVDYELYNFDGVLLDTSIEDVAREGSIFNANRTYQPLVFVLGTRSLIAGFQRGAQLLNVGGQGDFYIPSVYAYQNQGTNSGSIAPNENVLFRISLLELNKPE